LRYRDCRWPLLLLLLLLLAVQAIEPANRARN
jgi:hypothetical protein